MYNFFALVRDESSPVRKLRMTQPLNRDLSNLFKEQRAVLLNSQREQIDYNASYIRDDDEILCIRDFQVPAEIASAAERPIECPPLEITNDHIDIRGIMAADFEANEYLFQTFDRRRELTTHRLTMILSSDTFRRLEEPGLTLDSKLVAAIINGVLIFESYYEARKVLDLTDYYREATDDDLMTFFRHTKLAVENTNELIGKADSWIRKKVALIIKSQVLDNNSPKSFSKAAKVYGVQISFSGTGNRRKIVLPSNKSELKIFLRFLDESIYTSLLSNNRFIANSKRLWLNSSRR